MPSLREVRRKIRSVQKTKQVTKAMKMIAAARVKKAQAALFNSRPYAYKVQELVEGLLARLAESDVGLPEIFKPRVQAPDCLLVIFTSDKGLCGAFNVGLLKYGLRLMQDLKKEGRRVHLFTVGKKGRDFFFRQQIPMTREFPNFIKRPAFSQAQVLADEMLAHYVKEPAIGRMICLFTQFKNMMRQEAVAPILWPALPSSSLKARAFDDDYIYEPKREEILSELLPRYLRTQIFRIILESYTSEQASRMNVMENATRNATDVIDGLTLLGNKIRQAGITREILEVISGAEALT